jgi:hypothetical protein
MLVLLFVTVVVKNYLVEYFGHSGVRVVGSSVDTNSRINVLGSGENHLLETDTRFIFLSLEFIEHFWGDVFAYERFGSCWPHWWSSELFWFG